MELGVVKDEAELRTGELNSFQDVLFDNEMNAIAQETVEHYGETNFKLALRTTSGAMSCARACSGHMTQNVANYR